MVVQIRQTDIPGLFDVFTEDGREYRRDLTLGQIDTLAARERWVTPSGVPVAPSHA